VKRAAPAAAVKAVKKAVKAAPPAPEAPAPRKVVRRAAEPVVTPETPVTGRRGGAVSQIPDPGKKTRVTRPIAEYLDILDEQLDAGVSPRTLARTAKKFDSLGLSFDGESEKAGLYEALKSGD